MPTATVNTFEIHYREAGSGFPVVLVHGFTGNARNWALTVPALADRFRTVSVDLRGHGQSAKPTREEDYRQESMADDVYQLLQHLGISDCYLVGHSMGGMVAQLLTLAHPDVVRALVLVDTAADMPETLAARDRRAQRERLAEIARTQGMEAVFEEQLRLDTITNPSRAQLQSNPQFLENWRAQFLMTSPEAYIYCSRGLGARKPLLDELTKVSVPTLIICGENDEPFVEPSRRMHQAIPGSELAMLAGSGHTPQIEVPAEFNRVLLGFLSKVHEGAAARA